MTITITVGEKSPYSMPRPLGPWELDRHNGNLYISVKGARGAAVARVGINRAYKFFRQAFGVGPNWKEKDEGEFNESKWVAEVMDLHHARLLAAAPDLLEALQELVSAEDRLDAEYNRTSHPLFDKARAAIAKATMPADSK